MKRVGSAKVEWRLYRRMMNSPDGWQRIYREAVNETDSGPGEMPGEGEVIEHAC